MRLHSSQITGSLTVSGSIIPDGSGSWDLGSENHTWKDLHILSSSIKIYSDIDQFKEIILISMILSNPLNILGSCLIFFT